MMTASSSLITLDNVGYEKSGHWLVRGVKFNVDAGKIVTLIGPNGSGKSTTAKIALGISDPTEGRAARRADLRVGYVPQKLNIDWTFPLTVERFVHLTGQIGHLELDDALQMVGISHLRHQELGSLSGGEFQRALLARAIARKPNLLVLDEPVQGVDFNGETEIYGLIRTIRDTLNCGILLISHDLHLVMAATDLVVCLNGHMCCHGTPAIVAESKEYHALFGSRTAGLAPYQHEHDHTHLPDGRVRHLDGTITDHCHPEDGHHHGHPSPTTGTKPESADAG
jgi:zinc transport system ATP-binding protein